MKSTEFCYWLQGFFELTQDTTHLSKKQSYLIAKHLALVFEHEAHPNEFCCFLNGFYQLNEICDLAPWQTSIIKEKLSQIFVHSIDNSYPDCELPRLNAIHATSFEAWIQTSPQALKNKTS